MKTPRILIVDDEPGIRQSLRGILEDEGFQVAAVENGEACLDLLARSIFELVILDIWLPGIDGLETLNRIQAIPQADRPVVVVISGHGTIETRSRPPSSGRTISWRSRFRSIGCFWLRNMRSNTGAFASRTTSFVKRPSARRTSSGTAFR